MIAALVFTAMGATSVWLWQHEQHNVALNHRANLDFSLREISSSIEQRMASYEQVLRGVQGFMAVSNRRELQLPQSYVDALQLGADFAGIQEIRVVERLPTARRADFYVDPLYQTAMDTARDSGRLTMTGKLKPLFDAANPSLPVNFVIFLPLYQGGRQPETLADRRAGLIGWVMASVRMNELMASLYGQHVPVNDIKIHDGVQLSDETLMFDSTLPGSVQNDSPVELTEYLVLAGRTWAVTVRSRGDFAVWGNDSSTFIALGGAGFTLLLTFLAWMLLTKRSRAIAAATEMTAELREVKERFELIFDTSPDAVVVSRCSDGIVVDTNNRFTVLTGFEREELLGRCVSAIRLWADPAAYQKFNSEVNEQGFCENFEASFLMKDGQERVSLISGKQFLIRDVPHVITITRDISERKEIELRMTHMAQHDSLTGLPNRALFYDLLQQELAHAKRDKTRLALMFLDLDHFKSVNDTLGHAVGDLLLKEAALRMIDCVRQSDTVGRIGGDEFVVLLPVVKDDQDAFLVALKMRHALEQPFLLKGGQTVHISCSTGISTYPEHGDDDIELSKNADAALYQAKALGRNRVELFRPSERG